MLDAVIVAWLETATVRPMALSSADPAPLVLVVNDSVPPRETWREIARRAACSAFPDDKVLTYLLVRVADPDDGVAVPSAFYTETVPCDTVRASFEEPDQRDGS